MEVSDATKESQIFLPEFPVRIFHLAPSEDAFGLRLGDGAGGTGGGVDVNEGYRHGDLRLLLLWIEC